VWPWLLFLHSTARPLLRPLLSLLTPWDVTQGPPHTSWRRDGGADSAGGAGFGADGLGDEDAGPSGFPLPSTSSPDASMRRGARRRGAAGDAMRGSLNTMLSMQVCRMI
jgi:hypothetical protein